MPKQPFFVLGLVLKKKSIPCSVVLTKPITATFLVMVYQVGSFHACFGVGHRTQKSCGTRDVNQEQKLDKQSNSKAAMIATTP